MSLFDIIKEHVGDAVLRQIGERVGLAPDQLERAVSGLAPALGGKLAEQASTSSIDAPPAVQPATDDAIRHGNDILGQIFGSKDTSRDVAADASAATGVEPGKLKVLLPILASVVTTVIASHQAKSGQDGSGGLLGSLSGLGGLLGQLSR